MLKAIIHSKLKTEYINIDKINTLRHKAWVDLENPSDKEIITVAHKFDIPVAELKHALDVFERQRTKITRDYSLIIFAAPTSQRGSLDSEKVVRPFGVIIGKKVIITIHKDKIEALDKIDIYSKKFKDVFNKEQSHFIFEIFSSITQEFQPILERIDEELEKLEDKVLEDHGKDVIKRISSTKRSLLTLRKAVMGNKDVATSILKSRLFRESKIFEELYVEIMQLSDLVELYRERIASALEIYFTYTSNKVNLIMKSFTVIASILLLPMLITSFYGMNIPLPIQTSPAAFYIMLLIIAIAIFIMLTYFKKKKWI